MRRIEMPSDTFHVEFSRDSRLLYAAPAINSDAAAGLWVYDVRTGRLVDRRSDGGEGLEISTDHRMLAYGQGSDLFLSDAETGGIRQRLREPQGLVTEAVFSTDDRLVAAVTDEPAAYVWEVETGRLLETIALDAEAESLGFDTDGDRLLVPADGRIYGFDLTGRDRYVQRTAAPGPVELPEGWVRRNASPFAPAVAVSTYDPERATFRLRVLDRSTGRTTARLGADYVDDWSDSIAWSPDGRHLAVSDSIGERRPNGPGTLRVVDWRTGEELARRELSTGQLSYNADGTRLLAGGGPDGLVLLDASTLDEISEPVPLPGRRAVAAEIGPGDDTAVAVTTQVSDVLFWAADRWLVVDLRTGETLLEGQLQTPAWSMAVSPDRSRMATASPRGLEIVDLRSGESTLTTEAARQPSPWAFTSPSHRTASWWHPPTMPAGSASVTARPVCCWARSTPGTRRRSRCSWTTRPSC